MCYGPPKEEYEKIKEENFKKKLDLYNRIYNNCYI